VRVPVERGDTLVGRHGFTRVDFIKIDVQGYEWPVLQGLDTTVQRDRPVILTEYWPAGLERIESGASSSFLARLFELGYGAATSDAPRGTADGRGRNPHKAAIRRSGVLPRSHLVPYAAVRGTARCKCLLK
jgi:hypothetical protein